MTLKRLEMATHIADQLNELAAVVKTRSRANLTDASHILETIAKRFFNALYGWNLINLNTELANYPAADLADRERRIAIQVTNQEDSGKISHTAAKAIDRRLGREFTKLIIFFLLPKKPPFPKNFEQSPEGPQVETWDIADVLRQMQEMDIDALAHAAKVLDEESGRITEPPRKLPHLSPTRLRHGADKLIGREKELAMLDVAWNDPKTHILMIVAWGGVGKTALVVDWMAQMGAEGWRGAECVFDWSFYSQGSKEQGTASADTFITKALEFFGDPDTAKDSSSPWDKGARLAQLVAQERALLVLDGVEPLQHPPGPVGGKLKDPALEALLKGLAQQNSGLCIVTTRESVADLKPYRDTTSPEWLLKHLSEDAGAHLLFQMGVRRAGNAQIRADDRELKDAVREIDGHALTLQLLGRYLAKVHGGDIRKRHLVQFEKADTKVQGGHAFKVMDMYEQWLAHDSDDSRRQLAILRLLGLFDRPAEADCLTILRQEPAIAGLTESLIGIGGDEWNCAIADLVECGLILRRVPESIVADDDCQIDCHPLIREYFAKQLKKRNCDAWYSAHRRLFDHFATMPKSQLPATLVDMEPLYRAVAHGCQANMARDAWNRVFFERISRKEEFFGTARLGGINRDLAAVAWFFEIPWETPLQTLRWQERTTVLSLAGFLLNGIGQPEEGIKPLIAGFNVAFERGFCLSRTRAAVASGCLCQTYLACGRITQAIARIKSDIRSFREIKTLYLFPLHRIVVLRALEMVQADALHQSGQISEAQPLFASPHWASVSSAPAWLRLWKRLGLLKPMPLVFSLPFHWYSDLLITQGRPQAACELLSDAIRSFEKQGDHDITRLELEMFLGAAHVLGALRREGESTFGKADKLLTTAIGGLRNAGIQYCRPLAHLARAELYRRMGRLCDALSDLVEADQIAERYGPLLKCDVLIESCRLLLAAYDVHEELNVSNLTSGTPLAASERTPLAEVRRRLEQAETMVRDKQYHRRDPELLLIRAHLQMAEGNKETATKTLSAAGECISRMGCHRWDTDLQALTKRVSA